VIFVTVGAQMPFDRLVHCVDAWAAARGRRDVFAQIGRGGCPPRHIEWTRYLDPHEFRQRMFEADLVVAHAGMGTVITALELGRPVLVLPRRGDLRETRNDHQVASARRLQVRGDVAVVLNETELTRAMDRLDQIAAPAPIASHAALSLLTTVRNFVRGGTEPLPVPSPGQPVATIGPESTKDDHRIAA
jgi:UDP-N-acetylglucosamine transferase subunit ALG13